MRRLNELRLKLVERCKLLEKEMCILKVEGNEEEFLKVAAKYEEVQNTLKAIHNIACPPKRHLKIVKADKAV